MRETKYFGCGNFSVVGPLKGKLGKFGYLCLFCGSYRCNRCRNPKLKRVRSEISRIASENKLNKMATLTLDPKSIPRRYRVRTDRYLQDCWRKMRVSLRRKFGQSIDYVGILEFQKNGTAHLHLLVGRFIEQKWLSDAWQAVGGGPIVVTCPSFCTKFNERVYITAIGCEFGFGTHGLQAAGAGGL